MTKSDSLSRLPLVSIVIPAFNYGQFVGQAIESILKQTGVRIQVIIIDDASIDNTPQVVSRYGADDRVVSIRHESNSGHIRTYNEGLAKAEGDYVGLLSADDYALCSDALSRQVAVFEANPSVGLVYTASWMVDGRGGKLSLLRPWGGAYVGGGEAEFRRLIWWNYIPASGTLVRRQCHEQLGWYDTELPHAGDWDMWLRITRGYDFGYIEEPMYAYRIHGTNMSGSRVTPGRAMDELYRVLERNFARWGPALPPDLRKLPALAMRHAAFVQLWNELAHSRRRRAWRALAALLMRSPTLTWDRRTYGAVWRLLLLTGLGGKRYRSIVGGFGDAQP